MGKRQEYEDDDGRTIADMSDVGRPSLWHMGHSGPHRQQPVPAQRDNINQEKSHRPWEDDSLSPSEQRYYILGALKAALLIAFVFIAGLGALVAFLLFIWT